MLKQFAIAAGGASILAESLQEAEELGLWGHPNLTQSTAAMHVIGERCERSFCITAMICNYTIHSFFGGVPMTPTKPFVGASSCVLSERSEESGQERHCLPAGESFLCEHCPDLRVLIGHVSLLRSFMCSDLEAATLSLACFNYHEIPM